MSASKLIIGAVFFGALALIIVFPLLSPGFILTFDALASPFKWTAPSLQSSTFVFNSLISFLSSFVSPALVEKAWLFLIFFLSGFGMYRLTGKTSIAAGLFAGSLYAVNPFVYERVLIGHWGLLLGYCLLPFIIEEFIRLWAKPGITSTVMLAVLWTLAISIDAHFVLIYGFVFLFFSVAWIVIKMDKFRETVKYLGLLVIILLLLNLNWLIPVFFGRSELGTTVSFFTINDLIAFQSFSDHNFGLVFNLLSGYGFWAESNRYFALPKDLLVVWPLLFLAILGVVIAGIFRMVNSREPRDKVLVVVLIAMTLFALDFSGGVALAAIRGQIITLYDKFPALRGLREPQKLVGLVMFSCAFLGAYGVESLSWVTQGTRRIILIGALIVLPFIYTPTVFGSFLGQIRPATYPVSWSKIKSVLDADRSRHLILAFPWHQYMRYRFNNNQAVGNLAPLYFGDRILSSREYETRYLDSHETRPEALHVSGLIRIQTEGLNLLGEKVDFPIDWAQNLSIVDVKYVLLAKEEDWQSYQFIVNAPNLQKIYEDDNFILYKNSLL